MIHSFLVGAAAFALLSKIDNLQLTILVFGTALLMVWVREAMLHLARENDRITARERMREWGLLP